MKNKFLFLGFLLLLCSFLVFDLIILSPSNTNAVVVNGTPSGTFSSLVVNKRWSETALRDYFALFGITPNAPPCAENQQTSCVTLYGTGNFAITGVVSLKRTVNHYISLVKGSSTPPAHFTISGAVESNGFSQPVLDILFEPNLDFYITHVMYSRGTTANGTLYQIGDNYFFKKSNYWHIIFGPSNGAFVAETSHVFGLVRDNYRIPHPPVPQNYLPPGFSFNRNLQLGSSGPDVYYLQKLLNLNPYTRVASSGPGSPGRETTIFDTNTRNAVARYQQKNSEILAAGNYSGLPSASAPGNVGPLTRNELNNEADYLDTITVSKSYPANDFTTPIPPYNPFYPFPVYPDNYVSIDPNYDPSGQMIFFSPGENPYSEPNIISNFSNPPPSLNFDGGQFNEVPYGDLNDLTAILPADRSASSYPFDILQAAVPPPDYLYSIEGYAGSGSETNRPPTSTDCPYLPCSDVNQYYQPLVPDFENSKLFHPDDVPVDDKIPVPYADAGLPKRDATVPLSPEELAEINKGKFPAPTPKSPEAAPSGLKNEGGKILNDPLKDIECKCSGNSYVLIDNKAVKAGPQPVGLLFKTGFSKLKDAFQLKQNVCTVGNYIPVPEPQQCLTYDPSTDSCQPTKKPLMGTIYQIGTSPTPQTTCAPPAPKAPGIAGNQSGNGRHSPAEIARANSAIKEIQAATKALGLSEYDTTALIARAQQERDFQGQAIDRSSGGSNGLYQIGNAVWDQYVRDWNRAQSDPSNPMYGYGLYSSFAQTYGIINIFEHSNLSEVQSAARAFNNASSAIGALEAFFRWDRSGEFGNVQAHQFTECYQQFEKSGNYDYGVCGR